jgi:hypothetical protein
MRLTAKHVTVMGLTSNHSPASAAEQNNDNKSKQPRWVVIMKTHIDAKKHTKYRESRENNT